ncbi:MAG: hypothetical protein KOO62_08680 [candidate division Zixibacteria bacterium]|nr:hypothetical protein [candidate division Zixibacteria bacterium]
MFRIHILLLVSIICLTLFATGFAVEQPVQRGLELLTPAEKQNAEIQLDLESGSSENAQAVARQIEELWNKGSFDEALHLFDELATLTDLSRASVWGTWRTPVLTNSPDRFGTDVLISTRDSVRTLEMEIHRPSGNLMAIIMNEGDGWTTTMSSVLSTDGGATWYEKQWLGVSWVMHSVTAAVWHNHCYVANYDGSWVKLRRFRWDTGLTGSFPSGGSTWDVIPSTYATEVVLRCNDGFPDNDFLYIAVGEATGTVDLFRIDPAITLHGMTSGITDFDRGLDAAVSPSIWYPIFASYISPSDYCTIARYQGTTSQFETKRTAYVGGSVQDETAIDVYGMDVVCIYEYQAGSHILYESYSTDIGVTWDTRNLEPPAYSPSLTMRGGAGLARAYSRQVMAPVRTGRFRWVSQDSIHLSGEPAVQYTDNWTAFQQDIEYIGDDEYGIAYVSSDYQAWFDRGDGCCQERGNVDRITGTGGAINVADLTYLVAYLFIGGLEPPCIIEGNVDGIGGTGGPINVADLTYLVAYLFIGGPEPPPCP